MITKNYVCVRYKNRRKYNQHFELRFGTSTNYLHIEKLIYFKQYLFDLLFSEKPKSTDADQSTLHDFYFLKRNYSQTFKCSKWKKLFLYCVYIGTT